MSREENMFSKFEEFKRNEPDQITIKGGGPNGSDIVLPKKVINGVTVYAKKVVVPL